MTLTMIIKYLNLDLVMSCDLISCREVGKQGKGKITDYIGEDSDDDLGDLSDEEIDFGDEFKMADDMEGDEEDCKYCLFIKQNLHMHSTISRFYNQFLIKLFYMLKSNFRIISHRKKNYPLHII